MDAEKKERRRWPGGYVHRQRDGRDLFIIEKQVGERRFHVSTRTHSLRAAMKHLERFEADPHGYSPVGVAAEAPLLLTAELADGLYRWQVETKGGSKKHAKFTGHRVAEWGADLAGVDLRKATLRDHIIPALNKRATMRGARIAALKVLYSWLRTERHILTSAEDPTLDLQVPQAIPEKRRRRKAVELERLQAVAGLLAPPYRDLLALMMDTGWHFTEACRFIRDERSEIIYAKREDTIAVLVTRHKAGEDFRTPINDPDVLAAAERLRERRRVPKRPNDALRAACRAAGVAPFTFGVMRHTNATFAAERGATKEQIAALLHHKDARTSARFYEDVSIPVRAVSVPKLKVVR